MPKPEPTVSLDEVASAFGRACRRSGVDYVFVGGFAVIAWGQPRTTSDLDVLARFEVEEIPGFVEALDAEGLETSARDLESGLREGSHISVFTPDPVLTVDIKPARTPSEIGQIEYGSEINLDGDPVRVARAADTVVFKVLFGSEQDLQDARSIVARQGDRLDRERLWTLARDQGILRDVEALVDDVDTVLDEDPGRPGS